MNTITGEQAYAAAYQFLRKLYFQTKLDDLGGLMGDMSLVGEEGPADPAIVKDWRDAVQFARGGHPSGPLTDKQAYAAMYRFVEQLSVAIGSGELRRLLEALAMRADGAPANAEIARSWQEAMSYARAGGKADRLRIISP
ncbi:MAG: hypothetical protein JSR90_21450 [Proteobacteria bacterium]|nr:hypothetical protein [Pseudomonadota bacterium]